MDLDNDGHRDILSGSYSRNEGGMAGLFQVLYGQAGGKFRKAEALKGTDGEPLIITKGEHTEITNICTRPFAVDWDGDLQLDIVTGNFEGTFYLFRGEGKGKFQPKAELIKTGDKPLKVESSDPTKHEGYHSDPFIIDWDGDGDLDLLTGAASGGVYWSENTAGKGKPPQLRPFQVLIKSNHSSEDLQMSVEETLTGPLAATRVWVADINGDGKLDLLVGDCVTIISPKNGMPKDVFASKVDDWKKELAKAIKAATLASAEEEKEEKAAKAKKETAKKDKKETAEDQAEKDEKEQAEKANARNKIHEEFRRIYEQRTEFLKEERTGFVWLYLQK